MVDLIITAVFIIILAVSAFIGLKKGFLKMIAGFIEYIVAFLSAYIFCQRLSVYVKRIPFIEKMITDVEMPQFNEGEGLWDKIKSIVGYIVKNVILADAESSETMKAIGKNYLADVLSIVISFVAIFIVVLLVLKLIDWILGLVMKAPVLKQMNGVLGCLFGIFCGLFWTWILSNAFVKAVLPVLIAQFPTTFNAATGETVMMKFFLTSNPVSLFFNALSWLGDKLS